jgi:hypothetical protein
MLKNKLYYYPFYCLRHFPDLESGLLELMSDICGDRPVILYEDYDIACKAGEEMLCDDDTYGILVFDKTKGFIDVYEQSQKTHWKILHDTIEKFVEIRG